MHERDFENEGKKTTLAEAMGITKDKTVKERTNSEWAKLLKNAAYGLEHVVRGDHEIFSDEELAMAMRIGADAINGVGPFSDPLREPLRKFALECESVLSHFDLERGPVGWRFGWSPEGAFSRLCQEVLELKDKLRPCDEDGIYVGETNSNRLARLRGLQHEACDVANFAMMIFDLAGIDAETCLKNLAEGVK